MDGTEINAEFCQQESLKRAISPGGVLVIEKHLTERLERNEHVIIAVVQRYDVVP